MENLASRQIETLLARYAESHRHPQNEVIHFICIPAIVFSLLGLLWVAHPLVAVVVTAASLIYYLTLSVPFAL
ncbi:MAG TPA: Mpo1-like protein, partial [Noviherbaspirillum sp.]|nr:Mpo1-like protein [Noviherbaspirillum sp.]